MKKLNEKQLRRLIKNIISEARSYNSLPSADWRFWRQTLEYLENNPEDFMRALKNAASPPRHDGPHYSQLPYLDDE
jgi:hypothetical protein